MERVGTAKLRNHLSKYLKKVNQGMHLLILDHAEPVAKLVPVEAGEKKSPDEIIVQLAKKGIVRLPKRTKSSRQRQRFKPIDLGGDIASQSIIQEREESW